jgi:hypothetical protein
MEWWGIRGSGGAGGVGWSRRVAGQEEPCSRRRWSRKKGGAVIEVEKGEMWNKCRSGVG